MKLSYVFAFSLSLVLLTSLCAMASEVIGHRGAAFYAPENTLASLETAWKMGVDGAEIDVHMSRDGKIMVIHDDNALRTAGAGVRIAESHSSELRKLDAGSWKAAKFSGEKIPFLEEALATVPAGKKFLIEIKCGKEAVADIVDIVKKSGKTKQVIFISFKFDVAAAMKKMMPEAGAFWIVECKDLLKNLNGAPVTEDTMIAAARDAGLDGIDMDRKMASSKFINGIHAAGMKAYCWTVDHPETARLLESFGMDAITSNKPDVIMDALKGRR